MTVNERRISGHSTFPPQDYAECLQTARNIFSKARKVWYVCKVLVKSYNCPYSNASYYEDVWVSGGETPHSLNLGTWWRWVVRFMLWPLYLQGKSLRYPLDRVGGLQSCSGDGREKFLLLSRIEPWSLYWLMYFDYTQSRNHSPRPLLMSLEVTYSFLSYSLSLILTAIKPNKLYIYSSA
jgi:hypothetical protein